MGEEKWLFGQWIDPDETLRIALEHIRDPEIREEILRALRAGGDVELLSERARKALQAAVMRVVMMMRRKQRRRPRD
jgi:hypothetical protein